MKDKKFLVLCWLGVVWLAIFVLTATHSIKLNPRIEYLVLILLVGWFAYWTFSFIRVKPIETESPTKVNECCSPSGCGCSDKKKEKQNGSSKKTPKSSEQ